MFWKPFRFRNVNVVFQNTGSTPGVEPGGSHQFRNGIQAEPEEGRYKTGRVLCRTCSELAVQTQMPIAQWEERSGAGVAVGQPCWGEDSLSGARLEAQGAASKVLHPDFEQRGPMAVEGHLWEACGSFAVVVLLQVPTKCCCIS